MGSLVKSQSGRSIFKFDDKTKVMVSTDGGNVKVCELGLYDIEVATIFQKAASSPDAVLKAMEQAVSLPDAKQKLQEILGVKLECPTSQSLSFQELCEVNVSQIKQSFNSAVGSIGQAAANAAQSAIQAIYGIVIDEKVTIKEEVVVDPPRFENAEDAYGVLTILRQRQDSGFVAVKIPRSTAKRLLEATGLIPYPTPADVADASGELCNIMAGSLKQELNKTSCGSMELSLPEVFNGVTDTVIKGVRADKKYVIDLSYKQQPLLKIEVAFQRAKKQLSPISYAADVATRKALESMFTITLDEDPQVKEDIVHEEKILDVAITDPLQLVGGADVYSAVCLLTHPKGSGYVWIKVPKAVVPKLFEQAGIMDYSTAADKDKEDLCKELCNVIAGGLKSELSREGVGLFELALPEVYANSEKAVLRGIFVEKKSTLDFAAKQAHFLTVEVALKIRK